MSKYLFLIFILSNSFAEGLDPISSNSKEYSLQQQILDEAEDTRAYIEYLKSDGTLNDLSFEMALNFAPFTGETSREIDSFNYRKRSQIDLEPLSDSVTPPKVIEYATSWRDAIYNFLPNETGLLGWGFYSASTASGSRGYSGSKADLALVKVSQPKNSRYLDIRTYKYGIDGKKRMWIQNTYKVPINEDLFEKIKITCKLTGSYYDWTGPDKTKYKLVRKTALTRTKECHDIFVSSLKRLNISNIRYDFAKEFLLSDEKERDLCSNEEPDSINRNVAFVAVNSQLNNNSISALTDGIDLSKFSPEEKEKLKYLGFNMAFHYMFTDSQKKDPSYGRYSNPGWFNDLEHFISQKPNGVDLETYKKNHPVGPRVELDRYFTSDEQERFKTIMKDKIIGCDPKYREEDSPQYDPSRAQALFIQTVVNKMKTKTVQEANQYLIDCFKPEQAVFIDEEKDTDIVSILKIAGDLLNE